MKYTYRVIDDCGICRGKALPTLEEAVALISSLIKDDCLYAKDKLAQYGFSNEYTTKYGIKVEVA